MLHLQRVGEVNVRVLFLSGKQYHCFIIPWQKWYSGICQFVCSEVFVVWRGVWGSEWFKLFPQFHSTVYMEQHPSGILTYLLTYLLTYSMVQSPCWEANWFAASQEIPRISRNPKVHYRTHKRPPPVSILGQPNPVHIPTSHLLEIRPNIHPSTPRSPEWSLSLRFPHQDPIHPPLLTREG